MSGKNIYQPIKLHSGRNDNMLEDKNVQWSVGFDIIKKQCGFFRLCFVSNKKNNSKFRFDFFFIVLFYSIFLSDQIGQSNSNNEFVV